MTDKGRIFNQREIFELQQQIANNGIPMRLEVEATDNSIDLGFYGNVYLGSILKKTKNCYRIDYTTSNGDADYFEHEEWNIFKRHIKNWIESIKRDNPFETIKKENISNLSPKFYDIFREATIINEIGFKDSSGMIFRKTLEIIVKDFLKNQLPGSYQELINRKTIGQIVPHFYEIKDDQLIIKNKENFKDIKTELKNLKSLANIINNTFQIGNDFSHYERKLTEFCAKDIKKRIIKISDYIDSHIELNKLVSKQTVLNKEFETDKL